MKTLAVILNYNSFKYTDALYEQLKPYEKNDYDLIVVDNGSDDGKKSKYTGFEIERNVCYGGALNVTIEYFLGEKDYDSMLFLNNDLIVQTDNFVKRLKEELLNGYELISPAIVQDPLVGQVHWKQMWNWNSPLTRKVRWIDFQAPLFSRKLLEKINHYDDLLMYGWGNEVYTGFVCEQEKWNVGVCDFLPVFHYCSATIKENIHKPNVSNYWKIAEENQWKFFLKENMVDKAIELRGWGESYVYKPQ